MISDGEDSLFSAGNPYHVSGPEEHHFVGRREVLHWTWRHLSLDYPILIIMGTSLIGKSSVLLRLQKEAPPEYLAVYVDLLALRATAKGSLLVAMIEQVHRRLLMEADVKAEAIAPTMPASIWKALRDVSPTKRFLLLLDDLDRLLAAGDDLGWAFLDDLAELMTLHPDIQIVCACRTWDTLRRIDRLPFYRAPRCAMDLLSRDEVVQLIKNPAEGKLEFDYDAITRIDELTGRHPYYVQLLCGQIFERCSQVGHVGVVDIEPAINALGVSLIPPFQEAWESASSEGKLILSLLGSLKGAYDIVTPLEISAGLRAYGIHAEMTDIVSVLQQLVQCEALQQLGAASYRFPVELFRYWLRIQHPMPKTVASYRWHPHRAKPKPAEPQRAPSPHAKKWTLPLLIPFVTVVVALIFALMTWRPPEPLLLNPTPTVELATLAAMLVASTETSAPPSVGTSTRMPAMTETLATPTKMPMFTRTPTATRPLVLARAMPAIAFMRKNDKQHWQIWLMGADGSSPIQLTNGAADNTAPVWSPDGLRIAFVSERDGNKEIYTMRIDGADPVNLTQNEADDWTPAWSPDGTEIAFSSMRDGNWEIYLMWADGSYPLRLTHDPEADISPAWSPDGRWIAFASKRDGDWDIYVMDREGKNVKQLTNAPGSDLSPAWSPDGRYIAFESNREGNTEIYRMRADGREQINLSQTKGANDHWPTWSPDGSRLAFYSNRGGNWDIYIMRVDGSDVVNLTKSPENDQGPAWRP